MQSARLSNEEIERNKIDAFNFLQEESKRIYNQVLKIFEKNDCKHFKVDNSMTKKIKELIYSIEKPKNKYLRFVITGNYTAKRLRIDTHYIESDYKRIGSTGYGVNYIKNNLYIGSNENGYLVKDNRPEYKFEKITLEKYRELTRKRIALKKQFESELSKIENQIPYILR